MEQFKNIPGLPAVRINNIFCIGRNYALHAREMKSEVPKQPMVFLKPNSSIIFDREIVQLPSISSDVHHEVELVIAIGKRGKNISRDTAAGYIAGYGVGIDFTARDIQQKAKEGGKPWTVAKGFDTFAPISRFSPFKNMEELHKMNIRLSINQTIRQKGNTADMIFKIPELISHLSGIFTLQPGDLIFTGTPEGVGPANKGDKVEAILGAEPIKLTVHVE